jgi:hypothetical protein
LFCFAALDTTGAVRLRGIVSFLADDPVGLSIRFTSVLVGLKTLQMASVLAIIFEAAELRRTPKKSSSKLLRTLLYPSYTGDFQLLSLSERGDVVSRHWSYVAQYGIYVSSISALWTHRPDTTAKPLVAVLTIVSGAILFIADDWAIILDYTEPLKGRYFGLHQLRIHVANAVIIVGTVVLLATSRTSASIVTGGLLLATTGWRYFPRTFSSV